MAIIENMQREDLNPLEEAEGLNQMMSSYGLTQEQISKSVGKSRPYIANSLRLLKLPDYVKELITEGELTAGHGRTLVTVEDEDLRKKLTEKIISGGLSVRETERLVADAASGKVRRAGRKPKDPNLAKVERDLKDAIGTKVNIKYNGKKGKIELEFFSREELERLIEMLESLGE